MSRDKRFWRNVTLIALLHIALLSAVLRSSSLSNKAKAQSITWLSPASAESADSTELTAAQENSESSPESTPAAKSHPAKIETEPTPVVKSDIELPSVTPTVTPKPTPKPAPQPTRKPVPKSSPNKKAPAKTQITPVKKPDSDAAKSVNAARKKKTVEEAQAKKTGASASAKPGEKSAKTFAKAGNGGAGVELLEPMGTRQTSHGMATCCMTVFTRNGCSQPRSSHPARSSPRWRRSGSKRTGGFPISRSSDPPATWSSMNRSKLWLSA